MADYNATTDMTLEAAIAAGPMNDGDNLTISNGAVVTCTQTPSILIGQRNVVDGKLFIDGKNITSGNVINFVAEYQEEINVYYKGTFEVDGDWYSLGTTNGTNSQTFSLASYWGGSFEDLIPAIWVETGRRIDFDNSSGTAPAVGDWVYKTSNDLVMGRIVEVQSTYVIVKFLTGSVADNDAIEIRKIVDNNGPDYQITWTAQVANASGDIKEAGVYQEFANAVANGSSYISTFNHHLGGFVFEHTYQSNTLTMGSNTGGGFVPPSGCDVKVPNVHFSTSNLASYASGNTYNDGSATEGNRDNINMSGAGVINFSVCNIGSSYYGTSGAKNYNANYVGASIMLGSVSCLLKQIFNNCVIICDPFSTAVYSSATAIIDCVSGADITDCLVSQSYSAFTYLGIDTSSDVNIKKCISVIGGSLYGSSGTLFCYYVRRCENINIENCVGITADLNTNTRVLNVTDTNAINITGMIAASAHDYLNPTLPYYAAGFENVKDAYICDWRALGPSTYRFYSFTDCARVKIRCMGRIDDPDDMNYKCREIVSISGSNFDLDFARVYCKNSNYSFISSILPTTVRTTIVNCGYDYAKAFDPAGTDTLIRGLQSASGNPGGSTGIQESYASDSGMQFHDGFKSDTSGFIVCILIPPSQDNNYITIVNGNPEFNGDGSLGMSNGDIIEVEQSYFSKAHLSFTGNITSMSGTGDIAWGTDEWTNITVEFQYDTGSGWNGSWLNARTTGNWTGISSISGGVKLKYRFTATANVSDMRMFITETTTSIATQKANFYSIDQTVVDLTITVVDKDQNPISGVQTAIFRQDNGQQLMNEDTTVLGIATEEFVYSSDVDIMIRCRKAESGDDPKYKAFSTIGTIISTGFNLKVTMQESLVLN